MAKTYTLKSADSYDGRQLTLTCTQVPHKSENKSTINWTLTSSGGSVNFYSTGPTTVKINGQQVYYKARTSYTTQAFPAAKGSVSGSIIVNHDEHGYATVNLQLSTAIYNTAVKTANANWRLDDLITPVIASVTDTYIGGYTTLTTKNTTGSVSVQTMIRYECLGYVENLGMYYQNLCYFFQIPTKLYDYFGTRTSAVATVYCDTYNGLGELVAQSTSQFTIYAQAADSVPELWFDLWDSNTTTAALTGNVTSVIKGFSNISYEFGATPFGGATMKEYKAVNGTSSLYTTSGTFYNVNSGTLILYATDSQGRTARQALALPEIEYIPLTCNLKHTDIDTSGNLTLEITGNYFDGSFGKQNNSLTVQYRVKENDGAYGDWITATHKVTGAGYTATIDFTGLASDTVYNYQARAVDKLLTVESLDAALQANTIFDWSNLDFNFNVPIKINNQTVLRHNPAASNIVLSSNGGNVYIRPEGTDITESEVRITNQGNIEVKGDIIINGVSLRSKLGI